MIRQVSDSSVPAAERVAADVTAEGEAYPSAPQRVRYPAIDIPAAGAAVAVTHDILWCRIPLPIDLNHINVWLLDTGDGYVLIDTGMAASVGRAAWETLAQQVFTRKPLQAIFITHIHPDHIGLARWLQDRYRVPVLMSPRTLQLANEYLAPQAPTQERAAAEFFRAHGVADVSSILPLFSSAGVSRMSSGAPEVERVVEDGEVLQWGTRHWTALETNGHAEGHLCLSDSAGRLLISGDQVLPTISSNIGFTWRNGDANPLHSYLSSLDRLRMLDAETLVLPSHGQPFFGLRQRAEDLRRHHEEQLLVLGNACREPKAAAEILPIMFRRPLRGMHLFLALAEALAHLEYLVHARRLERLTDTDGVVRYVTIAADVGQ